MVNCISCSKSIERSICGYQKNYYHADCCRICTPNPVEAPLPKKEKSPTPAPRPPPPPPKVEIADPKKARAAPGRLNFAQIGKFEASKDVNCKDCKKKIVGQRFLTHKLGEFCCKPCNSLVEEKCSMCKNKFETEECFKDDEGGKLCTKCIKKYQDEKKQKAKQKAAAESAQAAVAQPQPAPPAPVPVPTKPTNVIHCDYCTKPITDSLTEFDDGNYHFECLVCNLCKTLLRGQKIYQEENGLACEKCKHTVKCHSCKKEFGSGESFYEDEAQNAHCTDCYNKLHSKVCSGCPDPVLPGTTYLLFQEKNYHVDCFGCSECTHKVGSDYKEFYMDAKGNKFCDLCIQNHIRMKTSFSTTTWTAVVYTFIDQMPSCFECKRQFKNNESFYRGENGSPYCVECYTKANSKKCFGCSKNIGPSETTLTINDRNYHPDCLKCFKCEKVLDGSTNIFLKGDQFACEMCI